LLRRWRRYYHPFMNQQIEQEDTAGSSLNGCDAF
jgi:hypothetical protein